MLHDCKQMLWLLVRHARTGLTNIAYAAGTDIACDDTVSDRLYQVYVLVIVIFAAFLSWLGALDVVIQIVTTLDVMYLDLIPVLLLLGYGVLFIALCIEYLRSFPVKLSYPDIAFIAASPIKTSAIALAAVLKTALLQGLCGIFVGYSIGAIVSVGSIYAAEIPLLLALLSMLLFVSLDVIASMIGFARLLIRANKRNLFALVAVLIIVLIVTFCLLAASGPAAGMLTRIGFMEYILTNQHVILSLMGAGIVFGVTLIALLSKRLSTAEIISENALYAELFPLRHLQMSDTNVYRELRRRRLLALRAPAFRLPEVTGGLMLVRRSALSLVRQYEGLGNLAIYALIVVPSGIYLLLGTFIVPLYILWICLLVALPGGQHELYRVFRDDRQSRMIRDHLPFGTLALLLLDSLPALLLTTLLSIAVVAFLPLGSNLPLALILVVLFNVAVVICGGLGSVAFSTHTHTRRISFELSVAVLLVALGIIAAFWSSVFVVLGAAVLTVLYSVLIRIGREL